MSCRDLPATEDLNSLQPRLCKQVPLLPDLLPAVPWGHVTASVAALGPTPCAMEHGVGSRQAPRQPPLCQHKADGSQHPANPPCPAQLGQGEQAALPACARTWPRSACTGGAKGGRAKLFPAHFSALTHLRALGGLQLVPSTPTGSASGTRGPAFPKYLAGAAQDDCTGQAEVSGLKSQAGVSHQPRHVQQ